MRLPLQTRILIADNFGIIKKGSTEVVNNEVVKDGYVIGDVESALNIDAIQKFLNTGDTDYVRLWEALVARVEGREPDEMIAATIFVEEVIVPSPEDAKEENYDNSDGLPQPTKRKGRPAGSKNKARA